MQTGGIIIGGGIAGLTAALALKQLGHDALVLESAPEIMPVGSGIWMAPNAMQVFERLGIAEEINAAGVPLNKISIADGQYRTIMHSDQGAIRARFGHTTTAILRARLQSILLHTLGAQRVYLSKTVLSVVEGDGQVTVACSDGSQYTAPFIIAADGIHSVVRQQLFPDSGLSPVRDIVWRGLSPVMLRPEFKTAIIEAWHEGLRFGFSEVVDGLVDWFAVQPVAAAAAGADNVLPELIQSFSSFAYPVGEILAHANAAKIIRNEIRDVVPMRRWSKGRVCLIGDAAHASTPYMGQGGCQAVEDAYVVAQCLHASPTPQDAFTALERTRLRKALHIVNTSRKIGAAGSLRGLAAAVRNIVIRATPQAVIEQQFIKVYSLNY